MPFNTLLKLTCYFIIVLPCNISSLNAQLASISCICELEALLVESKKTKTELIIEETSTGYAWSFKEPEEIIERKINLKEEEKNHVSTPSLGPRVENKLGRKKVKRKRTRLKSSNPKKYNGNCPVW